MLILMDFVLVKMKCLIVLYVKILFVIITKDKKQQMIKIILQIVVNAAG